MPSTTFQPRARRPRPRRRRALRWLGLILIALLCVLGATLWAALPTFAALRDARTQLGAMENTAVPLRRDPSATRLTDLDRHDVRLIGDLRVVGAAWGVWRAPLLWASRLAPHVHEQLGQVDAVLAYGGDIAQAAHLLAPSAAPLLAARDGGATTRLVDHLAASRASLSAAAALLDQAAAVRQRIAARALPSMAQTAFARLDPLVAPAPAALRALAALPAALGADGPRDYLVVPQNSEDLRASGGFIGTVGILHVVHGQARLIDAEDSYAIDGGRRPNVDPPLPIGVHGWTAWYFRDANWSADFPTTARLLETFYRLGTGRHVDGVIAFDSLLTPRLLTLTGPVVVPGYGDILTPLNAFARIDAHVNILNGPTNKAFAVAAYQETFTRLLALSGPSAKLALTVATDSVRARDLLLYADDPRIEAAVRLAGADGAIAATRGDYLYAVDTNTSTNKVNQFVRESLSYRARIARDRGVVATATLTYTNTADTTNLAPQNGAPFYSDFVRLFVPADSTLLAATGLNETWPTYAAHGKTQFSGYFEAPSHQSRTIVFRYRIPPTVDAGDRYTLLVQRQPGTAAMPLTIDIAATEGVRLDGGTRRLTTALGADVSVAFGLAGGTPRPQQVALTPSDPPASPGSQPEPWVTVPTGMTTPTQ